MYYSPADTYVNWPTDETCKLPFFSELPVGSIFSFSPYFHATRFIKINKKNYKVLWDVENNHKDAMIYNGSVREEDPLYWRATKMI